MSGSGSLSGDTIIGGGELAAQAVKIGASSHSSTLDRIQLRLISDSNILHLLLQSLFHQARTNLGLQLRRPGLGLGQLIALAILPLAV
jgi:hypothetical protein